MESFAEFFMHAHHEIFYILIFGILSGIHFYLRNHPKRLIIETICAVISVLLFSISLSYSVYIYTLVSMGKFHWFVVLLDAWGSAFIGGVIGWLIYKNKILGIGIGCMLLIFLEIHIHAGRIIFRFIDHL